MPPTASSPTAARRPATRMSQVFSQMMADCPSDVQVYGACVADITGGVTRGACASEFEKLQRCFQRAAMAAATKKK